MKRVLLRIMKRYKLVITQNSPVIKDQFEIIRYIQKTNKQTPI